MTKDTNKELDKQILELWHREFDPKNNPPMPVTQIGRAHV